MNRATAYREIIVVLGVSGSGKSTIGAMLAKHMQVPFDDADDFHPIVNKEKMAAGQPLNDEDRTPWLETLAYHIADRSRQGGGVLACSALKEKYRKALVRYCSSPVRWVHLDGSRELLEERLSDRQGHFFKPHLLDSQLDTLEPPTYGWRLDIKEKPEAIVSQIIELMKMEKADFGLVGLGVMGKSLVLNLASRGIAVSAYNKPRTGEERVAKEFAAAHADRDNLQVYDDLPQFLESLHSPKKIMLMVSAGPAVDAVLDELIPQLEPGDIVIDGGNSHYYDTKRRVNFLREHGIHFVGCGVSGGEEGALKGPSIMPGGNLDAYSAIAKYLEAIAATDKNGRACCTYIGEEGSGHFVKMVHNGIEYAEMQLIAEAYLLLRERAAMTIEEIAALFSEWNQGELQSYLLEISAELLPFKEGDDYLVDLIYDAAQQKGTGGWSTTAALDVGVPFSTVSESVMARHLSALKPLRVIAAAKYGRVCVPDDVDRTSLVESLRHAYASARVVNHAIGFEMIRRTSDQYAWQINLSELARIWTNGCIIRSGLMEDLVSAFEKFPDTHLLLIDTYVELLKAKRQGLSSTVAKGIEAGLSLPVFSASVNYLNGFTAEQSSANIIQAQRDYFGAHTYRRKDKSLDQIFHTDWTKHS
ncbi:hypothetical protein BFP72_02205 [Reichenbachiella sp. 5M10]|uniref:decarboxylating NADP(+)-dependent phosphogluconate dehydrogenase n=1 Tax=Reichenbachiella sp. 5M10 TaxID=1889772 RepID=UPI000C157B81|nr:decarboxylating NADP(+)-dependent phosphogluconate dehydrogenase [Reichenbachiella sp. 5M10]PIB34321.1 hypothetical protein BFP72_02205 [Reichenbachiella sp. 5M10]